MMIGEVEKGRERDVAGGFVGHEPEEEEAPGRGFGAAASSSETALMPWWEWPFRVMIEGEVRQGLVGF